MAVLVKERAVPQVLSGVAELAGHSDGAVSQPEPARPATELLMLMLREAEQEEAQTGKPKRPQPTHKQRPRPFSYD